MLFASRPHLLRRAVAWLALIALVWHGLVPSLASAQSNGRTVSLCTALGVKHITLPQDQAPGLPIAPLAPKPGGLDHCPLCASALAVFIPPALAALPAMPPRALAPPPLAAAPHPATPFTHAAPRGPPLVA